MPYRTAPPVPEPIPDPLLLELERRARRARRIGLASVGAIALGVLGVLGTGWYLATSARRMLETDYAELMGCLDGQRPDQGTTDRVRRRQLAVMDTPPEERDLDRWPMSCRSYARHLQERAYQAELIGLSASAGSLHGKLSRFDALSEDLAPAIQALRDSGVRGLDELPPIVHAPPPEPASVLTLKTPAERQALSDVRSLDILMANEEPNPSSRVVLWLRDDHICAASTAERDLLCAHERFGWLGGSSAENAELGHGTIAHDSRTFPLTALPPGKAPCAEPCRPAIVHGHTMAGHAYAFLDVSRKGSARLEWRSREDRPGKRTFEDPTNATLVFDELVVEDGRGRLMHARLDADATPEPLHPIEDAGGFHPSQQGCTERGTFALRITGKDDDAIVFRDESGFHAPVRTIHGGRLVCSRDGVAWVVRPNEQWPGQVVVSRCTTSGCRTKQIDRKDLDRNDPALRATRWIESGILDDKLLVVWTAGERGGLRMRLAPPDRFATSRDVVLLDNRPTGSGKPPELEAVRVFIRDRFALVVLGTSEGPRVIRIEPDASFGFVNALWTGEL